MRKKWLCQLLGGHRKRKVLLMMKLCISLMLFFTLGLSASTLGQQERVNLNLKDVSIKVLFDEIQKQTDLSFVFNTEQTEKLGVFSVQAINETVESVLRRVLKNIGMMFEFDGGLIIVRPEPEKKSVEKLALTGSVKDEKGETLPGVTIRIKNTTLGFVTDVDGNFKFDIPKQDTIILIFSFVGYKTQEFQVKNEKPIVIVLKEDVAVMDEVVVTGIFTKAKESYTGAVTTITAKDLQRVGNRNLVSSIRNIDPSFNIAENITIGSDPNKLPDITVRGTSSLDVGVKDLQEGTRSTANLPLFIMDGFEISLERMMDLDENQVESITLLKDASATAMYGTRGANGVVVIVTKKPEPGRIRVTYKGSLNIEAPDLTSYNLLNAREKLEYEWAAGLYDDEEPETMQELWNLYNQRKMDAERGVNTYWLKYPVRTGVGHKHSLRAEGGDEIYRYAVGLSYNDIAGAMKGSNRKTLNGNVFLSYKYNNLTFQNDLQVSFNRSYNSPYGTFNDFAKINSYWSPYDEDGNLVMTLEDYQYATVKDKNTVYNPLYNAKLPSKDESRYTQIQNNFAIEWQVLPELSLRGRLGITSRTDRSDKYKSAKHTDFAKYSESDSDRKGTYTYGTGEAFNYEADFTLNYSKVFAEKHQVYVGLGYNFAQEKDEFFTIVAEGISNINMDFLGMASKYEKEGSPKGTESFSRRLGGLANANYTYDRRYFVDASVKVEGSSKFGSDNRFAPFWSVGIGWNMHHEAFMADNKILNVARLKLSYGTSGSQSFNSYQAMTTFKDYGGGGYQGWYGVYMIALGNEDLGWQKTKQLNIGTELEFFNGRVRINADYYNKVTDDLLSDITLPSASGFDSYKANVGKVANTGVELGVNVYLIRDTKRDLIWLVGGTLARNKNEIKKISNSLEFLNEQMNKEAGGNPSFLYKEGQSMNTIFAVESKGIDPSNGKEIFVKLDGTETYKWDAKDKVPCGIEEPKIWGNLNTMLRFKGFTLNAIFGYRYGGQMYNYTLVSRVENIKPYNNADKRVLYDRWKEPGDNVLFKSVRNTETTNASSRFVMDENTLECRSISLGYDWDAPWLAKAGISYLTVTGYMEDVFRVSSIKQERGMTYPFSRKFSLALSVRF